MGVPVSVDSDDLEALIHAANAAVMVQQALTTATNDPAYQRCKPLFVEATGRANRARAQAIRVPSPDETKPMTDAEYDWCRERLKTSYSERATKVVDGVPVEFETGVEFRDRVGVVENPLDFTATELRKKRLIEVANRVVAIRWRAGPPWEEIGVPQMVFRLTPRGEAEFERIERARRAKA